MSAEITGSLNRGDLSNQISTVPISSIPAQPERVGYIPPTSRDFVTGTETREVDTLRRFVIGDLAGYDAQVRQDPKKEPAIDCYAYRPKRHEINLTPISREERADRFEAYARKIDELSLTLDAYSIWETVRNDLRSQAAVIREEEKLARGEPKTPYEEYLPVASGGLDEPRTIDPHALDDLKDQAIDLLENKMGEKFNPNSDESIRYTIRRRAWDTRKQSQEDIEGTFRRADRMNRKQLARILGRKEVENLELHFKWDDVDAFWKFFHEYTLNGRHQLRANSRLVNLYAYYEGLIYMYATHEPCHGANAELIKIEVQSGKLDPVAGLLTYPGSTGFQREGLAQWISELADYDMPPDGQLDTLLYRLRQYALVNGLYRVEEGASIETAAAEIRPYMLNTTVDETKKLLRDGTEKPANRAFLPNYGRSAYAIWQLKNRIGSLTAFLPYWFRRPLSPRQFINPPLPISEY